MKSIYWQPHNLPRAILLGFCAFILLGLIVVETFKSEKKQAYYDEKIAAATLTQQAFTTIKKARVAKKLAISRTLDPQRSGLIGQQLSSITSDSSDVSIKQSTINPNVAALFVEWLKQVKAKPGDIVAVNMTGSFPALDMAMLATIKTLDLQPLITYSAAASQFGANIPYFSWTDMYHILSTKKVFDYPVLGISIGGKRDNGYGMSSQGHGILERTIQQYGYPFIDSKGTVDGIDQRMALYEEHSKDKPIVAYINVGGNMASIGLKEADHNKSPIPRSEVHSIPTGVVDKLPIQLANTDSVAVRFLKEGVPVINIHNVSKNLLLKYKFPTAPAKPVEIGSGALFYNLEYATWLAILIFIIDIMVFCIIVHCSKKHIIRYKR